MPTRSGNDVYSSSILGGRPFNIEQLRTRWDMQLVLQPPLIWRQEIKTPSSAF
ncbi:putative uncharacterized protein [Corynebacterium casei UCMA 3821]|uniref:Uncharacterized protein n=1 Tax=Corynebacterium casei UCMA 3821 TaxID=1110505 RepID=G7HVP9_9CORY|nr:putative uncharacterized protein [Corynebacterium casei UCMA 3821]